MRRFALALCGIMATAPMADALSCMKIEPTDAFETAAAAAEPFIVVQGSFSFDPAALPQSHGDTAQPVRIDARFTGMGLDREGFTVPLSIGIALDVGCSGPWCGALTPDTPYLAFLERGARGYQLSVGACPAHHFEDPGQDVLDRMLTCLRDGCQAG